MIFGLNDENQFTIFGNALSDFGKKVNDVDVSLNHLSESDISSVFTKFEEAQKNGSQDQLGFIELTKQNDETMAGYLQTVGTGKASFDGYSAYCKKAGVAQKGLGITAKAAAVGVQILNAAISMGVSLLISAAIEGITKAVDYFVHTTEELIQEQQDLIDKNQEVIDSCDSTISSLESLQTKLSDAKGNKSSLAAISGELNDVIGETPGLIDAESSAYEMANSRLQDLIETEKELREEAKETQKVTYSNLYNQKIDNNNGFDVDINKVRSRETSFIGLTSKSTQKNIDDLKKFITEQSKLSSEESDSLEKEIENMILSKETVGDIYDKLSQEYSNLDSATLYEKIGKFAPVGYKIDVSEYQDYFDRRFEAITNMYSDEMDKVDELFGESSTNQIVKNWISQGFSKEDIQEGLKALSDNSDLGGLVDDFYASLANPDTDSQPILDNIRSQVDTMEAEYPQIKNTLEAWYNSLFNDVSSNVKSNAVSFDDMFALENASGNETELGKTSKAIDTLQTAYSTLNDAIDEYNNNGSISIDTLQSLMSLGDDWMDYLIDENGNLKLDKESLQDLTQSRLEDMKALSLSTLLDNVSKITDETTAKEFLTTTNYKYADSIEAVTKSKIDEQAARIRNLDDYEKHKKLYEADIASFYSAYEKNNDLFNKVNINTLSGGGSGSGSSSNTKLDFIEYRLKEIEDLANEVQSAIDEAVGAADKNALIDQMQNLNNTKAETLTQAVKYYTDKANKYLSQIPDNLKSAAQNGAIAITEFIGDSNDATVEAIQNYREMSDSIADATNQLAELRQQAIELEKTKFDNLKSAFEAISNLITNNTSLIESQISYLEGAGERVGSGYYNALIEQSNLYLKQLQKEREQLNGQLASAMNNGVQYGSDEWYDMYSSIKDVDKQIIETTASIEEYGDALRQLDWDVFDKTASEIDKVKEEMSNLIDLMDTNDNASGDVGGFSGEAIGSIGLYMEQMDNAKYVVEKTNAEIDNLNKSYGNGDLSIDEYTERLESLEDVLWNNISAYNDAKDAIEELAKARVEEEIDSINEATDAEKERIDALKDELQAQKDLENYKRSLEEKQSEINDIQNQINARAGSTDAATIAEREKLEADLASKLKDLQQTQEDQAYDDMIDNLDKEQKAYEDSQQDKIDALEDSLKDSETLIQNAMNTTLANSSTVLSQLNGIAQTWGITITGSISKPWTTGSQTMDTYKTTVLDGMNAINNKFIDMQNAANVSSQNISTYVSGINTSINAVNTSKLTSLVDMLSSSINTSGITGSINSIKSYVDSLSSSVGNAIDKIGNLYNTVNDKEASTTSKINASNANGVKIVSKDNKTGYAYVSANLSASKYRSSDLMMAAVAEKIAELKKLMPGYTSSIQFYAKGGEFGSLDSLARSKGEDHISTIAWREGERIITPEQNKAFLEGVDLFSKLQQNGVMSDLVKIATPNTSVIGGNMSPALNIGSMLTVEGNVSEDSLPQLQKMLDKSKNEIFNEFGRMLVNKSSVRAR